MHWILWILFTYCVTCWVGMGLLMWWMHTSGEAEETKKNLVKENEVFNAIGCVPNSIWNVSMFVAVFLMPVLIPVKLVSMLTGNDLNDEEGSNFKEE